MIYLGACLIAGIRLAREKQVNVRVIPTGVGIEESVDLAHEIYNRVFRKVPERLMEKANEGLEGYVHRHQGIFANLPHTAA
jgi:hypothetical protein